jgi:aryl-alcohol dehydrogenase-like predicted oxidoreductase
VPEVSYSENMEYTHLGDTGLEVSRLCLGCMNFGSSREWMVDDEAEATEVIHEAIDSGINFLDTANVYSRGESERIVGEAIEGIRDELVLATKVRGEMADRPNGAGLSKKHVLEQCHASLDRLGTDYLDLYQIHRWDDETPIEETLSALDHLVDEGYVRYVGASTMPAWKFTKALYTADVENLERFVCMQPEHSLVYRHEERNLLPVCEDQGIGVIPWSPLAGGFLTGKYERNEGGNADGRLANDEEGVPERFDDQQWEVLEAVRSVAAAADATPLQVSLAWLLEKDVVDAPIVGPRSVAQLEENIGAVGLDLSDEQLERLEEPIDPVWPKR